MRLFIYKLKRVALDQVGCKQFEIYLEREILLYKILMSDPEWVIIIPKAVFTLYLLNQYSKQLLQ